MKRNFFYLLVLLCSMSVFTACGDDDDDVKFPIDEKIAGTYKGTLDVELDGENIGSGIPNNISITNAGDNKINMGLKDFVFLGMNLNIDIQNCEVKESGDGYTFTGSHTLSLQEPIGDCPTVVNGVVSGQKITINLDITVPRLGNQKVKVTYKGTRLTGSESSEAKILSFTFDSDIITEQPVIDESTGNITFKVSDAATAGELKLVPTITISDKATISPASGVIQNFSNGNKVSYTVVAENGKVKTYSVYVEGIQNIQKFSFEEWDKVEESGLTNAYDMPKPTDILATSAEGAGMLKLYGVTDVPVFKTNDKKAGTFAIKLVTLDTSEWASILVPAITSGSLFTGKFDLEYLDWITYDKLDCTRFGIPYTKKPLRFKGSYKYTPGQKFIDGSNYPTIVPVPGKKDECSIQAVLFKVTADDEVLTGKDINNSDKRVAVAALADGTAKEDYTDFDIEFKYLTGKTYEAGAKYKLAIVCSSSKEGDFFKGAGGSTLILDELEIVGE